MLISGIYNAEIIYTFYVILCNQGDILEIVSEAKA